MKRPEQGLTLVELLIAMVIFALIITGTLSILPHLVKVNRNSGDRQTISIYANGVIEQTRVWWLTKVNAPDAYPNFTAGTLPSGLISAPTGVTCATPAVSVVATTGVSPATTVSRRLLSITCTPTSQPAVTVVSQIGRPE